VVTCGHRWSQVAQVVTGGVANMWSQVVTGGVANKGETTSESKKHRKNVAPIK